MFVQRRWLVLVWLVMDNVFSSALWPTLFISLIKQLENFSMSMLILLLSWWAHWTVPMGGRCHKVMRNSTRLWLSWNTSVMSMESPKYRWRSAAHFGQKRSKCSGVSSPVPQWGQIGDVMCPVKAWYEAVDVSLLSLSWWIALCACRGTPGGILELSWPLQHLKCQLICFSFYHLCFSVVVTVLQSAFLVLPWQQILLGNSCVCVLSLYFPTAVNKPCCVVQFLQTTVGHFEIIYLLWEWWIMVRNPQENPDHHQTLITSSLLELHLAISELWFGQEWEGILPELLCSSSIVYSFL